MTLLAVARCENCGRDVRGLPERRQEGKLWFCSQSCFLQHESRLPRLDAPGAPPPARVRRGRARKPLSVAWKTVKVLVTLVVLAVTAFVIVVIVVAVKEQKKAETPAPITRAQFRQVKVGMPPREVRRLLGDPTDAITPQDATTGEPIAGARCWYYGTELSKGGGYEVCFTRSRVDYKLRLG